MFRVILRNLFIMIRFKRISIVEMQQGHRKLLIYVMYVCGVDEDGINFQFFFFSIFFSLYFEEKTRALHSKTEQLVVTGMRMI